MKLKLPGLLIIFSGCLLIISLLNPLFDGNTASVLQIQALAAGNSQDSHASGHGDPFAEVFRVFTIILILAVIGRWGAQKLKQSPVLGELIIGIIAGAVLYQAGAPDVTIIRHYDEVQKVTQKVLFQNQGWEEAIESTFDEANLPERVEKRLKPTLLSKDFPKYYNLARSVLLFSSIGVVLLLFMVGLECSIEEMVQVGASSLGVALLGVIFPFTLGYVTTLLLLPQGIDQNIPIFIGATLCATSIGITARVFKDLNKLSMDEARIVLGAAVLDDVLGLIVLAVVTGIITSGSFEFSTVGMIILKAAVFFGALTFLGIKLLRYKIAFFERLDKNNMRLLFPFALLMILSWLADAIGLATIVGAFAAGLIIKEEYFSSSPTSHHKEQSVESILSPLEGIFAPVFFVLMGLQVDVSTFADMNVLFIGVLITVVAVAGKMAASIVVKGDKSKLVVGIGLIPRGEVGLIFASIGKSLGVLDDKLFSVIIIVVLLTTLVTPPLLTWAINRKEKAITEEDS